MDNKNESQLKKVIDIILVYNLYVIIIGAILLLISFLLSIKDYPYLYNFFQNLWYPIFIPAFSIFFTAILLEVIISKIQDSI